MMLYDFMVRLIIELIKCAFMLFLIFAASIVLIFFLFERSGYYRSHSQIYSSEKDKNAAIMIETAAMPPVKNIAQTHLNLKFSDIKGVGLGLTVYNHGPGQALKEFGINSELENELYNRHHSNGDSGSFVFIVRKNNIFLPTFFRIVGKNIVFSNAFMKNYKKRSLGYHIENFSMDIRSWRDEDRFITFDTW